LLKVDEVTEKNVYEALTMLLYLVEKDQDEAQKLKNI